MITLIDKTFTVLADILLKVLPASKDGKTSFFLLIAMECLHAVKWGLCRSIRKLS